MRVAHFRESFSALSETSIYEYYTEQLVIGVDATFYTFKRVDPEGRPAANVRALKVPPWYRLSGLRPRLYSCLPGIPADAGGIRMRTRGLRDALQADRPDIVHAHFAPAGLVACQAAHDLGIPVIVGFFGYDASELKRHAYWRPRFEFLFGQAVAILALSEEMRAALIEIGAPPERTFTVHVGRNLSSFPYSPKQPPLRRWLSVGRLVDKKGFSDAIEAFNRLIANGRDVHLDIIGEGPLRNELESEIATRKLQDRVRLLGSQSNVEVADAMRAADAFILCSKTAKSGDREGTPVVLIEAQAMGLPCVSTQHAGIPEMFPPGYRSNLAPEGDADAIARAVQSLMDLSTDDLSALTLAARRYTEEEFGIEAITRRLLDIYQQVLDSPR